MRNAIGCMCRAVCFIILGFVLLLGIQNVLSQKWVYPSFIEDTSYGLEEFNQISEKMEIQAVFLGASHALYGIDPMAIYARNGIVTFNLGSTGQPIEASCFLLSELLERHHPSLIVFDVSRLFQTEFYEPHYRAVLDNVPLSLNKIRFAWEYASHYPTEKRAGSFLGAFLPIYRYHDRWVELSGADFTHPTAPNYYRKGYYLTSRIVPWNLSVERINEEAQALLENVGWTQGTIDGIPISAEENSPLYETAVDEAALLQLGQMKQLCDKEGVRLVLLKIPSVGDPQYYPSTWTRLRSEEVKKLAAKLNLDFVDLFYDANLQIDWIRDTMDGGNHLNYMGAAKVSSFLADFLEKEYSLTGAPCKIYEEDLSTYRAMCGVAQIQMTDSLPAYLDTLSQRDGITVFLSVADDMMSNLSAEGRPALKRLGLQTDFDTMEYSDAFLAVIENSTVHCEMSSNRRISKEGALCNGQSYLISSCGWLVGTESKIVIDGIDYSLNHRGINVVVLDNTSGQVLDSVCFDTWDAPENQFAIRDNNRIEAYLREYEQYLMIEDAKNGIGA